MRDVYLHVKKAGKGQPLVLLHGWGFDGSVWDSLSQLLSHDYELYQVDLPGFGLSDVMDFAMFKQCLLAQLPPQFMLIGWSMGGLFATRLAVEAPFRVTRLINVASSPCFLRAQNWPGVSLDVLTKFHQSLSSDPRGTLNDFIHMQLHGLSICERQNVIDRLGDLTQDSLQVGLSIGLSILSEWDLRADLYKLNLPVFYLFGRLDAITPYRTMAAMQRDYPHFTHQLIAGAAHVPFLSHIDEFMLTLQEWLE